ncbi:hypothetical protein ALISP_4216 [Alicycliphilus sp. B1]|nr:hypothetical protein ALISP_4216 [Alicycliphilus sp. B1]
MAAHASTTATLIVLLPLLFWRLRARYRRLVGRQRTNKYRPWITLGIYAAILGALAWAVWGQWPALQALAGGLAAGWLLSRWAWRRTVLEATREGLYYTPHTHLGRGPAAAVRRAHRLTASWRWSGCCRRRRGRACTPSSPAR